MAGVDLAKAKMALDIMREKEEKRGKGGKFFNLKDGENSLRLLPPWNETGRAFVEKGSHFNVVKGRSILCPKVTSNKPCPICDLVSELFKTKNKDDRDQALLLAAKTRYLANVLMLDKDSNHDGGVYTFEFGATICKDLLAAFNNPEYGDFTDPQTGVNVRIVKSGEKMGTNYVTTFSRKSTPIANWEAIKSKLSDLDSLLAKELLPYEKIKGILEGTDTLPERENEAATNNSVAATTTVVMASPPTQTQPDKKEVDQKANIQAMMERLKAKK